MQWSKCFQKQIQRRILPHKSFNVIHCWLHCPLLCIHAARLGPKCVGTYASLLSKTAGFQAQLLCEEFVFNVKSYMLCFSF